MIFQNISMRQFGLFHHEGKRYFLLHTNRLCRILSPDRYWESVRRQLWGPRTFHNVHDMFPVCGCHWQDYRAERGAVSASILCLLLFEANALLRECVCFDFNEQSWIFIQNESPFKIVLDLKLAKRWWWVKSFLRYDSFSFKLFRIRSLQWRAPLEKYVRQAIWKYWIDLIVVSFFAKI